MADRGQLVRAARAGEPAPITGPPPGPAAHPPRAGSHGRRRARGGDPARGHPPPVPPATPTRRSRQDAHPARPRTELRELDRDLPATVNADHTLHPSSAPTAPPPRPVAMPMATSIACRTHLTNEPREGSTPIPRLSHHAEDGAPNRPRGRAQWGEGPPRRGDRHLAGASRPPGRSARRPPRTGPGAAGPPCRRIPPGAPQRLAPEPPGSTPTPAPSPLSDFDYIRYSLNQQITVRLHTPITRLPDDAQRRPRASGADPAGASPGCGALLASIPSPHRHVPSPRQPFPIPFALT